MVLLLLATGEDFLHLFVFSLPSVSTLNTTGFQLNLSAQAY